MATQAERREATRRRLIDAARRRFAADGYDETSTEQIREEAGVSRGAMYHHFASKREVFEAVFREVSAETIRDAIRQGNSGASRLDSLIQTCLAWLSEVRNPHAAAILLDQGPHVLGWERARDLEAESSLGLMEAALRQASDAGEIEVVSVPVAARLLNAVLAEAALIAANDAPATDEAELEKSIRQFIEGLTPAG